MLIVLRGNSGSGKTTTTKLLRETIIKDNPEVKIAVIEQDYFRRLVLKEKQRENGDNMKLIELVVNFALKRNYYVILEGILSVRNYEKILRKLDIIAENGYFYYFDIPFQETLKRHATKPNAHEFGEAEMHKWWHEKDLLSFVEEKIITVEQTQPDIIKMIRQDTSL